jgi:hypothetical protein
MHPTSPTGNRAGSLLSDGPNQLDQFPNSPMRNTLQNFNEPISPANRLKFYIRTLDNRLSEPKFTKDE